MKKVAMLIIVAGFIGSALHAQYRVSPNRPYSQLNSNPGYIIINELTGGYGLGGINKPYAHYFFGFNTVHGYQVNKNFIFAGGTGVSVYDAGVLVPLFIDFRFSFYVGRITPYLFGDGGLLLNVAEFNATKLFINPGAGVRYSLSRKIAANLGAGFLSQVDGTIRSTFVNIKAGMVYKF